MGPAEIRSMFERVNNDCIEAGNPDEPAIPICKANAEFYAEQLSNLEFSDEEIQAFVDTLVD